MLLTPRVAARLDRDFKGGERDQAIYVMSVVRESDPDRTAEGMERVHAAMLVVARGHLTRLLNAAALAELDWRDLFVEAGLAHEDWRDRIAEELGDGG
jgi:hypothetical protein